MKIKFEYENNLIEADYDLIGGSNSFTINSIREIESDITFSDLSILSKDLMSIANAAISDKHTRKRSAGKVILTGLHARL